jgi:hypothetical protein
MPRARPAVGPDDAQGPPGGQPGRCPGPARRLARMMPRARPAVSPDDAQGPPGGWPPLFCTDFSGQKTLSGRGWRWYGSVAAQCPACDGWAVRSGSVAQERMRLVMGLTVVGAALLASGVILVLVGSTLHLRSPHAGRGFVHAGEAVAICGLAFGIGLLVMLIMDLADRAGRGGKGSGPQPGSEGLIPLPSPETRPAGLRQEPVVEFKLASRYVRPDRADNHWQPAAGSASYPHPGNGPDHQAGGSWSPGPAYAWSPQDDWGSSAEGGWSPAESDNWAGDGQDDWGHGGQQDQQEWAAAGQGGWGSPGQDGWGQGGQQQWAPNGQGGWVRAGQGDWGQGGQPDQPEWAPAGPGGWVTGADHDWGGAVPAAPRAAPSEPAPDVAVTKSVESGDTGAFDDTEPIPVIRDAGLPAPKTAEDEPASGPEPGQNQSAPPSVFEPAGKKSVFEPAPKKSVFEPGPKKFPPDRDGHPDQAGQRAKADSLSAETQAKLEQIKDLYMTAEAIGEDALVKHFDQLSQRQRSLIREFFEQSGLGSTRTSALLGDDGTAPPNGDSTQDGASLPG